MRCSLEGCPTVTRGGVGRPTGDVALMGTAPSDAATSSVCECAEFAPGVEAYSDG